MNKHRTENQQQQYTEKCQKFKKQQKKLKKCQKLNKQIELN